MRYKLSVVAAAFFGSSCLFAMPAHAQCPPETFESFSLGINATSIIPGVTMSVFPDSCGGLVPRTVAPFNGTSSGSVAIGVPTGCPDFSPDGLRLTFDFLQSEVSFTVGSPDASVGATYECIAYNNGGIPVDSFTVVAGGGVLTTVHLFGAGDIRRVDILNPIGLFEAIDDLLFDIDDTPPVVEIDSPAFDTCVCAGDLISVTGSVDDPDGSYGCDTIAIRPINAAPADPWVDLNTACGAFSGNLHTIDTTGLAHGRYYLRLTGTNACGLTSSDVTVIRVDANPPNATIASPAKGETVCGEVRIIGTVNDSCSVSYILEARPVGGEFQTISQGGTIINCDLGLWNTTALAGGDYEIRVAATDECGLITANSIIVTVDNSEGCQCTADINDDGIVDVNDLLLLLSLWGTIYP